MTIFPDEKIPKMRKIVVNSQNVLKNLRKNEDKNSNLNKKTVILSRNTRKIRLWNWNFRAIFGHIWAYNKIFIGLRNWAYGQVVGNLCIFMQPGLSPFRPRPISDFIDL